VTVEVREHEKTPLWRNATFLKWAAQLIVLGVVLALFVILGSTAADNIEKNGRPTFGFKWLTEPFGVNLREGIDTEPGNGARAILVGMVNTLRIAITGIFAATILGTIIGVARLSKNWIVNKLATVYIETIRNIPLLVQMFFWSALVVSTAPGLTEADVGSYFFKASNKGFGFAWIRWDGGFFPWLTFVVVGIIVGRYVAKRRHRLQEDTGRLTYPGFWWLGTVAVFAIVGWFAWPLLQFLAPVWDAIAGLLEALPAIVVPIVIAIAALALAALWIRNFFESRRTPAGFGKLTDDDWFRVIFAGVAGVAVAVLAFLVGDASIPTTTGQDMTFAELFQLGIVNFFEWLSRGFEANGGTPLIAQKATVVQAGRFTQYGDTGAVMTVPFFAVWIGVTLYTAAFIAEIVRGGIRAVSKGQTEAAQAVGLKRSQYLRFIILPQAFRIILPPLGNQYLNLTKNTSLGIAVGFVEIVAVGFTTINQTGFALPVVLIWMLFYLTLSLIISAVVNYYNRKLMLVER
jgi:general L-amino acid transport system permease protein